MPELELPKQHGLLFRSLPCASRKLYLAIFASLCTLLVEVFTLASQQQLRQEPTHAELQFHRDIIFP